MMQSTYAQCPDLNICITDPTAINQYEYSFQLQLTSSFANYTAIQINTNVTFSEDVEITSSTMHSSLDNAGWDIFTGSNSTGILNLDENNQDVAVNLTQLDLLTVTYEVPPNNHTISISVNAFKIDDNGQTISCSVNVCSDVLVEPDGYEISGDVDKFGSDCSLSSNHDLPDVTVNYFEQSDLNNEICSPVTNSQGQFSCDVLGGGDYRIVPFREIPKGCDIDAFDIYHTLSHILGLNCFDEEWQAIAANTNLDNKVSGSDIIEMRKVILDISDLTQEWRFITAQDYASMSIGCNDPLPTFDEFAEFDNIQTDRTVSFGAIKVGDVDGQCTNCDGSQGGGGTTQFDSTITVSDGYASTGISTYNVYIEATKNMTLHQWQADIEISGAQSIRIKDQESWHEDAFVSYSPEDDRLRVHYLADTTAGTSFQTNDKLLELEVTISSVPTVSFNESIQAEAFDGERRMELKLQ